MNIRGTSFYLWTISTLAISSGVGRVTLEAQPQPRASDLSSFVAVKETVLKYHLFQIREAIDKYHAEKKRYPNKLQTLVNEGYISQIPADPFTNRPDWKAVRRSSKGPGIFDIRSASNATATDGTVYSQW